jgi:AraC-like DNA-binding protein
MASAGSVSLQFAARLVAAATVRGADPVALLAAVGLAPASLSDRDGRMSHRLLHCLWNEAARLTNDEAFGLHAAELSRQSRDNVLAYAFQHSATLGEGYRRSARYLSLLHSAAELLVLVEGAEARVRILMHDPLGTVRHGPEFSLAMSCLAARQCVNGFAVRSVSFRHGPPRDSAEHERIFGAPLRFESTHDELVLDSALLSQPMRDSDPALCAHLDSHLEHCLGNVLASTRLIDQVRRVVAAELRGGGLPDLEDVAARLHMSARSLQRRLQLQETSFQDVVNDIRCDLARRYLAEPRLSIAEVAFLLGFAEVSNFYRAFRRWTGVTPAELRRRALAPSL